MKKKIFFIVNTSEFSGAESVNFSIIEGLKKKYDFYWVSKSGNINKFLAESNINWIEIKKLSVKEIKRIIKEYKPDILHATDFRASVICSLLNTKIPVIAHLHNNSPWLKKFCINSFSFLYAGIKVNKILTVSSSIEKEFIFSKFIKNKITCIGNPVSRNKILKKVTQNDYNKIYDICCVARLTEQKNPKRFIKIIYELKKKNNDIKVVWVGSGELLNECLELCKKYKLENNIKFVGFQKNPYKYMASSKIFMLTSSWEGYGLVVFEALTFGLPCVVSNVGGIVDIVTNECGKLCISDEEYLNCIENLLMNKMKYEKFSSEAIKRSIVLDNFDEYINYIDKVYEEYI